MFQILSPRFEVLRGLAQCLAVAHQEVPEAVRVVVGQASLFECLAEDLADRSGVTPELFINAGYFELAGVATFNAN